ncbi:MAG TPA: SRPBCC family protein [Candidatus Binatia bacterium]|nr:SRPBCC family protein [Candidatus Binatia bacterium]
MASNIVETIDIAVPVRTAYNQWTQFEEFPQFMQGVESVRQLDDATLHWCAEIGGRRKEWTARITEQIPDKRIAWTSIDGAHNAGVVTFHRLSDDTCRITLQLDYEPEGALETVGDAIGLVSWNTQESLERFKQFIEERGQETGGYRGEIANADDAAGQGAQASQSASFARMQAQAASPTSSTFSRQIGSTDTTMTEQQELATSQQGGTSSSRQQQQGQQGGRTPGGADSPAEEIMSHQNEPASAQRGSTTQAGKTTSRDRQRQ